MNIINMTPHPIQILGESNNRQIREIPASGKTIRLASKTVSTGNLDGIPVSRTIFGDPVGLPEEEAGTYYIVSQLVISACRDRGDLLVPADVVRDDDGRIIGCRSLGRSEGMPSEARSVGLDPSRFAVIDGEEMYLDFDETGKKFFSPLSRKIETATATAEAKRKAEEKTDRLESCPVCGKTNGAGSNLAPLGVELLVGQDLAPYLDGLKSRSKYGFFVCDQHRGQATDLLRSEIEKSISEME